MITLRILLSPGRRGRVVDASGRSVPQPVPAPVIGSAEPLRIILLDPSSLDPADPYGFDAGAPLRLTISGDWDPATIPVYCTNALERTGVGTYDLADPSGTRTAEALALLGVLAERLCAWELTAYGGNPETEADWAHPLSVVQFDAPLRQRADSLGGDPAEAPSVDLRGPPGPPGQGGDPYDQTPEMDGEASAGVSDEYARGDHRHPTDTSRMAATATGVDIKAGGDVGNISIAAALVQLDEDLGGKQDAISDLATIRSGAAAGATAVQPAALSDFVGKTGDQQMQGDLTVSRAGGAPPSDYVMVGNTMGSNATSFIAVNNDGKQLAMSVGVGNDPAIITQKGDLFGAALTPANFGTLALQEGIAPAFSTSSTYAVGDYVTHEGLLYKCSTAVSTAGAWDSTKWTAVSAMAEIPAPQVQANWAQTSSTAKDYIKNKPDLSHVVYFQNDNSGGSAHSAVSIGSRTGDARGQPSLSVGTDINATGSASFGQGTSTKATNTSAHAEGNGTIASGNTAHAEGYMTTAAGNISHSEGISTYAAGRPSHAEGSETTAAGIASHADGYRAVTAASGSGSSAATPHDYAFAWQGVSTGGYYRSHGAGTYNVNPVGGTAGFYIGEDSLASLLRYAFAAPTPTVSGTSATVACEDRAINDFTIATGITSLTITPPAAVTGRARDFFCRVTLTDSSLQTVTLPAGQTVDIGQSEINGMTQGVNLLMFTEIAGGHWLASRRSAS